MIKTFSSCDCGKSKLTENLQEETLGDPDLVEDLTKTCLQKYID